MRRVIAGISVFVLLSSGALAAEVQKEQVKKLPMPPGAKLTIRMDDGSVRISTWKKREAELVITRSVWARSKRRAEERLQELEVKVRRRGDDVEVVVYDRGAKRELSFWDLFNPDNWQTEQGAEVHFEIRVPVETELWLEVEDADIQLEGEYGRITVEADDGDVELQDLTASKLRIETDDGDVDLYNVDASEGRLIVFTDDGRVRVEDCSFKDVDAETDDADVVLLGCEFARLDVRTSGGDVEIEPELGENVRIRVDTEDGDVILSLPEELDADLDLTTMAGRIRSDFDVRIDREDEEESVRDRLGKGGARIMVNTEDGDIILEKR